MRRFYVAGLAHDASSEEVARMLAPMGNVLAVDMPLPKTFRPFGKHLSLATNLATSTEDTCRGFAFVDVEVKDERAVRRVTAAFEGSKARGGGKLRIRDAKPAFDLGEYKRKRAEEEIACEKASDVHQREKTIVVEPGAHFARTVRTLTFTPDANRVVTSATKAKAKAKELPVEAPTKTRKMDKRDSATLVGRQTNYDDDDDDEEEEEEEEDFEEARARTRSLLTSFLDEREQKEEENAVQAAARVGARVAAAVSQRHEATEEEEEEDGYDSVVGEEEDSDSDDFGMNIVGVTSSKRR